MNNEKIEKIENWINGALPPNEAAAFEAELKSNPELFKQAKTVRLTQLAFQKQAQWELQEKIRVSVQRQRKRDLEKWLVGAGVIVALGAIIWFNLPPEPTQLGNPGLPMPPDPPQSDMATGDDNTLRKTLPKTVDQPPVIAKINYKERMAQLIKEDKDPTITHTYFAPRREDKKNTNHKDSLLKKGWISLNNNQPTDSIAYLLKPINGSNPYVFDILGQSYLLEGKYELAFGMFDSLAHVSYQYSHYSKYKKLQCAGALYDTKKYREIADDLLKELLKDTNRNKRSPFYQKAKGIKDILLQ